MENFHQHDPATVHERCGGGIHVCIYVQRGFLYTPYLMGGNSPKMLRYRSVRSVYKYLSYNRSAALSVIMFLICSVSAAVYIYTNLKEKDWEK